jgi:hypothetical protein
MKVRLSCKHCLTGAELDEDSDPSVDLAAFCLAWMRGKACRCAGFSLDAAPAQTPATRPSLSLVPS